MSINPNEELLPGMASYMEDTNVDVSVEVGSPEEVVEATETAAEEASEVVDADAEVQEDADAAEMILRRYNDIERMEAHVAKFGVDRSFLSLMNHNGVLANNLRISLPSCESFDAVGDPQSADSIACMQGFSEAMKSVWEFIKKMCAKIKAFIGRVWEAVKSRFTSLDANIGRLRKAHSDRVDDPSLIKDEKAEAFTMADLDKMVGNQVDAMFKRLTELGPKFNKALASIQSGKSSEAEADATFLKDVSESASELVADLKKQRKTAKKTSLKKISWADAKSMLDKAATLKREVDVAKAIGTTIQTASDQFIKVADAMKTRDDADQKDARKIARGIASYLNTCSSAASALLAHQTWVASQYVRTAGLRITRGSKSA